MRICSICRIKLAAQFESQTHMHGENTSTTAVEVPGQKRGA